MPKPIIRRRGVPTPFGPHKGEFLEKVVLQWPDFVLWLAKQERLSRFEYVYEHLSWALQQFNSRPFVNAHCSKAGCSRSVAKYSLYRHNPDPYYWCEECDPQSSGAAIGLGVYNDYLDGLRYLAMQGATRENLRTFVASLYEAKGLVGRRTKDKILAFFHDP